MNEIEQLKKRINDSGFEGVLTSHIRDDYEPIGQKMINQLTNSGEYVQRRTPAHSPDSAWRIFKKENLKLTRV